MNRVNPANVAEGFGERCAAGKIGFATQGQSLDIQRVKMRHRSSLWHSSDYLLPASRMDDANASFAQVNRDSVVARNASFLREFSTLYVSSLS